MAENDGRDEERENSKQESDGTAGSIPEGGGGGGSGTHGGGRGRDGGVGVVAITLVREVVLCKTIKGDLYRERAADFGFV